MRLRSGSAADTLCPRCRHDTAHHNHKAAMPKRIEIDDDVLAKVEARRPSYVSPTGFVNLLLDKALDMPVMLGTATEREAVTSKAVISKERKESKRTAYIDISELIPSELFFCRLELIDWWALRRSQHGRQAVGTEQAWRASQNALLAILRAHGQQVVSDTVQAALANAWRGFRESYAVLPKTPSPVQGQGRSGQKSISELAAEMDAMPSMW
jgi:hypothetical protein